MDEDRIRRISERAHQIWEREGRPNGREAEHWAQAERELASEGAASSDQAEGGMAREPQPGGTRPDEASEAAAGAGRKTSTRARQKK